MRKLKNLYHFLVSFLALLLNGHSAKKMTVIGVTGTDGKTSTTHLIYHILKTAGFPVSFVSTVEAKINGVSFDTGFHVTTPSSFALQKLIKKAYISGSRYLVLEITSHALDQYRSLGTSIDIAVITNISHEHIDYHRSLENYRLAKAKILKGADYAVLNRDDDYFDFLKRKVYNKLIPYSLKDKKNFHKINFDSNPRLIGNFNKYNIMAATNVVRILKIDDDIINKAIKTFPGISGRIEEIKTGKSFRVIVDFAHKINALKNILETVRKITPGKLIVVFGSAGERDVIKRPIMGEISATYADYTILTAEDPRTEDVRTIIDSISTGCLKKKAVESFKSADIKKLSSGKKYFFKIPDRQEALNFAIRKLAGKGDTVLTCGKGHEKSMCYGKTEYPWDEFNAVKKALYDSVKATSKVS